MLKVTLNFWFDGIDDCTDEEIKKYLAEVLQSGAEATNSEIELLYVEDEESGIL